jgi:Fungal Zn(2)-Cys(6) binuclear cluster domain
MATRGGPSRASPRADKIPQLSCELCRERKVRHDKRSPCSNCHEAGRACVPVPRKRLSRGRHVHDPSLDNDLRDRIARLEPLITCLDSTAALSASTSSTQLSEPVTTCRCIYGPNAGLADYWCPRPRARIHPHGVRPKQVQGAQDPPRRAGPTRQRKVVREDTWPSTFGDILSKR